MISMTPTLCHSPPRAKRNDKLPYRFIASHDRYRSLFLGIARDERWHNIDPAIYLFNALLYFCPSRLVLFILELS